MSIRSVRVADGQEKPPWGNSRTCSASGGAADTHMCSAKFTQGLSMCTDVCTGGI